MTTSSMFLGDLQRSCLNAIREGPRTNGLPNPSPPNSERKRNLLAALALLVLGCCLVFHPSPALCQQPYPSALVTEKDERLAFLQAHFAKFVPVQFQRATNSETVIQILHVQENLMEYKGRYYCGLRFAVPSWLDGDFAWILLMAKTEAQKDFGTRGMQWYIIQERGTASGFDDFVHTDLAKYPSLQHRFPYTHKITIQHLDMDRLIPGKTYAIWLGFKDKDMPDLAFAMTIRSDRGESEFGALPLK